jgi:hypothetical protein
MTRHSLRLAIGALSVLMVAGSAGFAQAATLALLQDGKTIAWYDTEQKKVTGSVDLVGGVTLVGFDVRPADGRLYGVAADGAIVTVDVKTGQWQKVSQLSDTLPTGGMVSIDFNPVADRMRIVTSSGTSLRVNVQDGKATVDGSLKFADADMHMGKTPRVVAAAYTNSFAGTTATTLFDIEMDQAVLVRQAPPNDGILATVGALGVKLGGVAFDIWSDGKGGNTAWLISDGRLYTVDLMTGKALTGTAIAGVRGKTTDMAILP